MTTKSSILIIINYCIKRRLCNLAKYINICKFLLKLFQRSQTDREHLFYTRNIINYMYINYLNRFPIQHSVYHTLFLLSTIQNLLLFRKEIQLKTMLHQDRSRYFLDTLYA